MLVQQNSVKEVITRFLKMTGTTPLLDNFDITTTREFIIHEQSRDLSPYTVQGKVRALKAFASWLCAEGYTPENLLCNLKLHRTLVNLVIGERINEIDRSISYQNPLTAIGCRNIAILITLLNTGLMVSEICKLSFEDAHIEEGYLKVMGKGSKERIVPIGALSQKMLWRYVIHFRSEPLTGSEDFLFPSLDGNRLKANAVKLLFNC